MKKVTLSDCTVELNENLTYGMNEEIKAATLSAMTITADMKQKIETEEQTGDIKMDGAALLAAKFKAAEVIIAGITDKEGKQIVYSKKWLSDLSIADGEALEEQINAIKEPKK